MTTSAFKAALAVALFSLVPGCSLIKPELVPQPPPEAVRVPELVPEPPHPPSARRPEIVLHALSLLHVPYRWGGKDPSSGLDCSGFVSQVFKQAVGLELLGNAQYMAAQGAKVAKSKLKAGDLVFFNTRGRRYSHVGIYVGDGRFVHALNKKKGVRVDNLNDPYYTQRFTGARNLLS